MSITEQKAVPHNLFLLLFLFILKNSDVLSDVIVCLTASQKYMMCHFCGSRVRKMTSIPDRLCSLPVSGLMLQGVVVVWSSSWWQ